MVRWWLLLMLAALPDVLAQWEWESDAGRIAAYRRDLAHRLERPMAEGMDVTAALEAWFAAEKLTGDDVTAKRLALYRQGMEALRELKPLPQTAWPANPEGVAFTWRGEVPIPDLTRLFGENEKPPEGVNCRIAEFTVDGLKQYGVVIAPTAPGQYPLILYMHGAAFGVPSYSLPWLANLAKRGYVIAAPALRGEDLFASPEYLGVEVSYRCEGEIENLEGEVNDALGMVAAASKLENVKPGKFAILGHSFGAGVGLLVAARSDQVSCVISYDAWLVNPFRYYWDRLRNGANNWLSWEEYVQARTVPEQLSGLMRRSIVHHAERVKAPVLLFMGGAYNGSVFHQSHADLVDRFKAMKHPHRYEIIPGGGHNFVLYPDQEPAQLAFPIQDQWLNEYHPPRAPEAAE